MAAIQQPIVLFILERGGEIKKVQSPGKVFQRIMKVSGRLGILTDYQVVQLAGHFMLKDSIQEKGGGAPLEIPAMDPLGMGQY